MYKHLTKEQRYYIQIKLSSNVSIAKISADIKVHPSTIYRELKRNTNLNKQYYYLSAQGKTEIRRYNANNNIRFAKFTKKSINYIIEALHKNWSPEQISGRMAKDIKVKISHKTIYKYIWKDKNDGGHLFKLLPHHGKKYKYSGSKRSVLIDRVDITQRPAIANQKKRVGDFEADTIVGKVGGSKNCLLTLVDRKTKFTFIRKIKSKSSLYVQKAIEDIHSNTTIPFLTITPDNGTEFANHREIARNIGCKFYFARPYRSCDRGLNEHINGNIRYFLPKKTDFANVSDDTILYIQNNLNNRPRKSLGFLTPNEVMNKHLKINNTKSNIVCTSV